MSELTAQELARRYVETLGDGRLDECMGLFHENAVVLFPKSLHTPTRVTKEVFRRALAGMTNVFEVRPRYTILHQTSEDDRSCIEFLGVGRLKTGAVFENLYCLLFVAEDGYIVQLREYVDTHYMLTVFNQASVACPVH